MPPRTSGNANQDDPFNAGPDETELDAGTQAQLDRVNEPEFTATDTPADNIRKIRRHRRTRERAAKIQCDICGRSFTALGMGKHRESHNAKSAPAAVLAPVPPAFDEMAGTAVTALIIELFRLWKPKLAAPAIPGWEEKAARANAAMLNKYAGPAVTDYGELIAFASVWGQFVIGNIETINANNGTSRIGEVPSGAAPLP